MDRRDPYWEKTGHPYLDNTMRNYNRTFRRTAAKTRINYGRASRHQKRRIKDQLRLSLQVQSAIHLSSLINAMASDPRYRVSVERNQPEWAKYTITPEKDH